MEETRGQITSMVPVPAGMLPADIMVWYGTSSTQCTADDVSLLNIPLGNTPLLLV